MMGLSVNEGPHGREGFPKGQFLRCFRSNPEPKHSEQLGHPDLDLARESDLFRRVDWLASWDIATTKKLVFSRSLVMYFKFISQLVILVMGLAGHH